MSNKEITGDEKIVSVKKNMKRKDLEALPGMVHLPRHDVLTGAGEAIQKAFMAYVRDAGMQIDPKSKEDVIQAFAIDLSSEIYNQLTEADIGDLRTIGLTEEMMAILSHEARGCVTPAIWDKTIPKHIRWD